MDLFYKQLLVKNSTTITSETRYATYFKYKLYLIKVTLKFFTNILQTSNKGNFRKLTF